MCPGADKLLSCQKPLIKQKAELNAFVILTFKNIPKVCRAFDIYVYILGFHKGRVTIYTW